jgi:Aminopeptidase P, N-terminal domain
LARQCADVKRSPVYLICPSGAAFTLFVPDFDPAKELWDGARLNCEAAVEVFGADAAFPLSEVRQADDWLEPFGGGCLLRMLNAL